MTVPRLAFWFQEYGWGVENYGVDPDVEVIMSPDDWAAGRDTQLETAVSLALDALRAAARGAAARHARQAVKAPAAAAAESLDSTLAAAIPADRGHLPLERSPQPFWIKGLGFCFLPFRSGPLGSGGMPGRRKRGGRRSAGRVRR